MSTEFETADAIRHDVHTLADDARALIGATAAVADDKVAEARKRLEAALTNGRGMILQYENKAREGILGAVDGVKSHPIRSIALAFGIGAILALLTSRRLVGGK